MSVADFPEPDNEMIVIPFHHRYRDCLGMRPIRIDDERHFQLVAPSEFEARRYPPGICIQ